MTITQAEFPSLEYSATQIVQSSDLDPSFPTRFVLPQFTISSPSSYCTTFSAKPILSPTVAVNPLSDALAGTDGKLAFTPSDKSA